MTDEYRHSIAWAPICMRIRDKFYKIETDFELQAILNNLTKNKFIDFMVSVIDEEISIRESEISKFEAMKIKLLSFKEIE